MLADDPVERGDPVHRLLHYPVVGDIASVIRKKRRARLRQSLQVCNLRARSPFCNARRRNDDRLLFASTFGHHLSFDPFNRIAGRRRVRHRDDRGKAAVRGGGETGRRRLGVRHARIPEMDVDIDKAWKCEAARHGRTIKDDRFSKIASEMTKTASDDPIVA